MREKNVAKKVKKYLDFLLYIYILVIIFFLFKNAKISHNVDPPPQ